MTGKLDFNQFDPVVAEKHSGLQGPTWEENSLNHFLLLGTTNQKFDEIRYRRDQNRMAVKFVVNR